MKPGDATNHILENLKEIFTVQVRVWKHFVRGIVFSIIIDQCRQSLGGHGYSAYAGDSSMYSILQFNCTWEG
jgi:acyl-CoA oxidase